LFGLGNIPPVDYLPYVQSFYELTQQELKGWLSDRDCSESGADRLFKHLYKFKRSQIPADESLSKKTWSMLGELDFSLPEITHINRSSDGTVKFLLKLFDGATVESVLIPFQGKYTLCVSSQVGCAMKCSFCYTGTMGLKRHLRTSEIIGQYVRSWQWLEANIPEGDRIRNIVFMGQGEPLHNFDAVKKACEILLDQKGTSVGIQRITISTSGYLPGLKRWVSEMPPVNIALSLHAVDNGKRSKLIPINLKYPLDEVLDTLKSIPLQRKQFITYEYLLIDQFNDSEAEARDLARLVSDHQALINLIPFNPFPGAPYRRPSLERVRAFHKILEQEGIPSFIRTTKGDEILAACGQLNTKNIDSAT
jgi:23S rRNA (adenine2503-C2)-methyltransferase